MPCVHSWLLLALSSISHFPPVRIGGGGRIGRLAEDWQMGNAGAEAAAAGGAAEDGPGAAAEASGVMTVTGGNVTMI